MHNEVQFWDFYLDAQINTVKYLYFCDTMSAFRDDAWPSKQRTGQPSELYVQFTGSTNPPYSWLIRSVRWRDPACMHGTCIRPQRSDTAQQTQGIQPMLLQCWPRVCWEDGIISLQICRNTMQSAQKTQGSTSSCNCMPGSVGLSMQIQSCYYVFIIFCLHSLSTWKARQAVYGGYPFFAKAKQTLTRNIQPMLFQC